MVVEWRVVCVGGRRRGFGGGGSSAGEQDQGLELSSFNTDTSEKLIFQLHQNVLLINVLLWRRKREEKGREGKEGKRERERGM